MQSLTAKAIAQHCAHSRGSAAPLLSRRRVLGGGLAGLAIEALALPSIATAQTKMSPSEALQALKDGNRRFVERKLNSCKEDLSALQQRTALKQEPFASVLSCADSRVPVELIFDQSIGQVFVNRVAGNVATTEIMASIEYGAAVLGTRVIMVLGHSNCGAVSATISGKSVPGQISSLYRYIRPAVNPAGHDVRAVTEANARIQAQLLKESSPVLTQLVKNGELSVVAAYFDVGDGSVTLLES